MDKKDILKKAQKENKYGDEMYNYLNRRGAQIAMAAGLLICAIGITVDWIINSKLTLLGYFMMITQLTMRSALHGFLAIKCKRRVDIACALLYSVALILFIICLIVYSLALI